jgi:transketolase
MRNAFVETIYELASKDKDVVLILGDIGGFILQKYQKDFPERFLNAGIAEANMIGVACGLAMNGKKPFVYTITPFVTARPYEQIKDDVAYANLNIRLIGIGSGIAYTPYGPTHHSIDDISLMRTLPNMTVISPADPREVKDAMRALLDYNGPAYLRLALVSKPLALKIPRPPFKIGKANILRVGGDAAIITTGEIAMFALQAAEKLAGEGIEVAVINMHTIKPLDEEAVLHAAEHSRALVTFEEHSIYGGLGSAVAEVLAEKSTRHIPFKRIGINDVFCQDYGSRGYLLQKFGLSAGHIINSIHELLKQ